MSQRRQSHKYHSRALKHVTPQALAQQRAMVCFWVLMVLIILVAKSV